MLNVSYGNGSECNAAELAEFYGRLRHDLATEQPKVAGLVKNSSVFVTARIEGRLIGLARGVSDGVRGYLTECKLDPQYQGPAAVTRTDGRIEHDMYGIAAEMARRVIDKMTSDGAGRIDVVAYGTEEDFLAELGFKRHGGLVGMTMRPGGRELSGVFNMPRPEAVATRG